MKRLLFIFWIILLNINIFCQTKIEKEIHPIKELRVLNSNFLLVLDTIIQMKDKIQWYKDAYFFLVEFDEDSTKPELIFVRVYEKIDYYYSNIQGFFEYKKHYFVVRGNSVNTMIFQKTNIEKNIHFGFPPFKFTFDGKPILGQFDAFAVWSIRNNIEKFTILSFFTNNQNDSWVRKIGEK